MVLILITITIGDKHWADWIYFEEINLVDMGHINSERIVIHFVPEALNKASLNQCLLTSKS